MMKDFLHNNNLNVRNHLTLWCMLKFAEREFRKFFGDRVRANFFVVANTGLELSLV